MMSDSDRERSRAVIVPIKKLMIIEKIILGNNKKMTKGLFWEQILHETEDAGS